LNQFRSKKQWQNTEPNLRRDHLGSD